MQENEKIINYKSTDGTTLSGTFLKSKNHSKNCIIMCHGLKTDREEYGTFSKIAKILADNGYDTFRFDFRGHGISEGKDIETTMQGLKNDLYATLQLFKNRGYSELIVLGASFGASVLSLLNYTYLPQVKKLIIWSGSLDANKGNANGSLGLKNYQTALINGSVNIKSKTTGKILTLSKTFMEEIRELKPEEKIKEINIPILFLQGTEDETSPYKVNKKIAEECKESYFVEIEGASHGLHELKDMLMGIQYVLKFLEMKKDKEKDYDSR